MAKHSEVSLGARHPVHDLEFADAAARDAFSAASTDVGRVCKLIDTQKFFILEDDSPLAWGSLADGSGAAVLPIGYVDSLRVSYVTAATVTVGIGQCRNSNNTFDIVVGSLLTADIGTSGANGLDTGTKSNDTWYALYVIADSSATNPTASLFSLNFSSPTLPAGYDKFRRVGVVRTKSTGQGNFTEFFQHWAGRTRRYFWDTSSTKILSDGSSTAFTAVSAAAFVPPSSRFVMLRCEFEQGDSVVAPSSEEARLRPTGSLSNSGQISITFGLSSTKKGTAYPNMSTDASQQIDYKVSVADASPNLLSINILGFDDEI